LSSKGQTIDSAYNMLADEDGMISFDKFKWAISRVFRVKIPENEIALYWNRFNLIDNKLTKADFYLKFSPYLKRSEEPTETKPKSGLIQEMLEKAEEKTSDTHIRASK
jgi:hypothetical protein